MNAFFCSIFEGEEPIEAFPSGVKPLCGIACVELYYALAYSACKSIFVFENLPFEERFFEVLVDDLTNFLKKDLFVRYQIILRNADEKQLEHFLEYFTPVCEEDEE